MRAIRTIVVAATTITALASLALPAHAGGAESGGDAVITTTVTASDCMDTGGHVVSDTTSATGSRCQEGYFGGHAVSG